MPASQPPKAEVLRPQPIDRNGPGTILRDFESLLESFGTEGLRSAGKYHLLLGIFPSLLSERACGKDAHSHYTGIPLCVPHCDMLQLH